MRSEIAAEPASPEIPLLDVRHLVQEFVVRGQGGEKAGVVHAVSDVSFSLRPGEALGVVGETGCGKSTLVRSILQAPSPISGEVFFRGTNLVNLKKNELRRVRRDIQMVFQDPYTSLDPHWKVRELVEEPLLAAGVRSRAERRQRVAEALTVVGLDVQRHGDRHPRQLSGGQCQRVAIARALTVSPALLVCDEAVSSLDVIIQAQILNLFEQLRGELDLSYLFVAHDLAVVKQISDRVAVMYLGKIVEIATAAGLYAQPRHPYTSALLSAIPNPDPQFVQAERLHLRGEPPSPLDPPSGCRFRTRCPRAEEICAQEEPTLTARGGDHAVACHFPLEASAAPEVAPSTP